MDQQAAWRPAYTTTLPQKQIWHAQKELGGPHSSLQMPHASEPGPGNSRATQQPLNKTSGAVSSNTLVHDSSAAGLQLPTSSRVASQPGTQPYGGLLDAGTSWASQQQRLPAHHASLDHSSGSYPHALLLHRTASQGQLLGVDSTWQGEPAAQHASWSVMRRLKGTDSSSTFSPGASSSRQPLPRQFLRSGQRKVRVWSLACTRLCCEPWVLHPLLGAG